MPPTGAPNGKEGIMIVEANGIKLHYTVEGRAGAPWVTFVTGMANDITLWDGQVAALAGEFQILRFDLPAHGGSDHRFP